MFRNCIRKYTTNIKYYEGLSKVNISRENRSYGKENRIEAINKFYDMTRETNNHNIDSHDNSLYKNISNPHVKDSKTYVNNNYPSNMANYNYSSKYLVEDFNRRWKKNLTMEEYYKYYACSQPV